MLPNGISWEVFSKRLAGIYGVTVGGGLGKLSGKIFRIGHMGALDILDAYTIVGAIRMCLVDLGHPVPRDLWSHALESMS